MDGEWRRRGRGREERWNEVALKLGQVYSVSVSPLIDHRHPPTTPCGSTYRRLWGEGGSRRGEEGEWEGRGPERGGRTNCCNSLFSFIVSRMPASPPPPLRSLARGTRMLVVQNESLSIRPRNYAMAVSRQPSAIIVRAKRQTEIEIEDFSIPFPPFVRDGGAYL